LIVRDKGTAICTMRNRRRGSGSGRAHMQLRKTQLRSRRAIFPSKKRNANSERKCAAHFAGKQTSGSAAPSEASLEGEATEKIKEEGGEFSLRPKSTSDKKSWASRRSEAGRRPTTRWRRSTQALGGRREKHCSKKTGTRLNYFKKERYVV